MTSKMSLSGHFNLCDECGMEIRYGKRQEHVFLFHLNERRLFECPLCDFAHSAFSTVVHRHIQEAHRDDSTTPRSRIPELYEKIFEWNLRCFKWTNEELHSNHKDIPFCHKCLKHVVNPYGHIAEVHMNINMHECPHCDYGYHESRTVKRHISNWHPDKMNSKPVENLIERQVEFTTIHHECFPGRRPMVKIVPNMCRVCGKMCNNKERMDHVLKNHILKPIYKCSHCPFFSSYDYKKIFTHGKEQHNGKASIVSNVRKLKDVIEIICTDCFPDWTEIDKEIMLL